MDKVKKTALAFTGCPIKVHKRASYLPAAQKDEQLFYGTRTFFKPPDILSIHTELSFCPSVYNGDVDDDDDYDDNKKSQENNEIKEEKKQGFFWVKEFLIMGRRNVSLGHPI